MTEPTPSHDQLDRRARRAIRAVIEQVGAGEFAAAHEISERTVQRLYGRKIAVPAGLASDIAAGAQAFPGGAKIARDLRAWADANA